MRRYKTINFWSFSSMDQTLTAIIEREDDTYVALCPELDIASQGQSASHARKNLREALELFRECASPAEFRERLQSPKALCK